MCPGTEAGREYVVNIGILHAIISHATLSGINLKKVLNFAFFIFSYCQAQYFLPLFHQNVDPCSVKARARCRVTDPASDWLKAVM